jgi:hypothetical protein
MGLGSRPATMPLQQRLTGESHRDDLTKPLAKRPFSAIPKPLVVVAVDELRNSPRIFRTASAGGSNDPISTLDVALATSAAPTFFPPHRVGDQRFVDGGLVANAPDLVLLLEAVRHYGCTVGECHLLSVGTAGSTARHTAGVEGPGAIGWIARHGLIDLIFSAQESLAVDQARGLRPGSCLRIDGTPPSPIRLDDVSEDVTAQLRALALEAVEDASRSDAPLWRRFAASRARL